MADECPYLDYRPLSDSDDGSSTNATDAADRAYCTAADQFVQAMRADVCNDRYGLDHETDCEIYRDAEGLPEIPGSDAAGSDAAGSSSGTRNAGGD